MAGVKGRSGTNKGKDKPFAEALRMEIAAAGEDHRSLRAIARKLLDLAASGDMQAIQQVADRMDGKPAQSIDMTGDIEHNYVARMPARVENIEEWQQRYVPKKAPTVQ